MNERESQTWKGMAFPPGYGQIIGRLDEDGTLVPVEGHSKEIPVNVHTDFCDSKSGSPIQTECESRGTYTSRSDQAVLQPEQ
jgi:hypothetical protein